MAGAAFKGLHQALVSNCHAIGALGKSDFFLISVEGKGEGPPQIESVSVSSVKSETDKSETADGGCQGSE